MRNRILLLIRSEGIMNSKKLSIQTKGLYLDFKILKMNSGKLFINIAVTEPHEDQSKVKEKYFRIIFETHFGI